MAKVDCILAGVIFAIGALYLWAASKLPPSVIRQVVGPDVFPTGIAFGMMLSAIWLWAESGVRERRDSPPEPATPDYRLLAITLAALLVYALLLQPLGYVPATILFVVVLVTVLESDRRYRWQNAAASAVLAVLIFYLFNYVLGIRLPVGLLEFVL